MFAEDLPYNRNFTKPFDLNNNLMIDNNNITMALFIKFSLVFYRESTVFDLTFSS